MSLGKGFTTGRIQVVHKKKLHEILYKENIVLNGIYICKNRDGMIKENVERVTRK